MAITLAIESVVGLGLEGRKEGRKEAYLPVICLQ